VTLYYKLWGLEEFARGLATVSNQYWRDLPVPWEVNPFAFPDVGYDGVHGDVATLRGRQLWPTRGRSSSMEGSSLPNSHPEGLASVSSVRAERWFIFYIPNTQIDILCRFAFLSHCWGG
jgi:hypothetical protein